MMILKLLAVVFAVTAFSTILMAAEKAEGSLSCCDAIAAVPANSGADTTTPAKNVSNPMLFDNTTPKATVEPSSQNGKKSEDKNPANSEGDR